MCCSFPAYPESVPAIDEKEEGKNISSLNGTDLDHARALDPCRRPEGLWFLEKRMCFLFLIY